MPADEVVFTLAGRLLEAPLSGALRAAVYRVIAGLPGVTMVANATDATGRHRIGIEMRLPSPNGGGWTIELIINPATYQFPAWTRTSSPGRSSRRTWGPDC